MSVYKQGENAYPWFKVNQNGSRYVMFVVRLVEKYVFTIAALGSPLLKYTFLANAMFSTKPLPVYGTHLEICLVRNMYIHGHGAWRTLVATLTELNGDDLAWHLCFFTRYSKRDMSTSAAIQLEEEGDMNCSWRKVAKA